MPVNKLCSCCFVSLLNYYFKPFVMNRYIFYCFAFTGKTFLLYSWKYGVDAILTVEPTEHFNVDTITTQSGRKILVYDLAGNIGLRMRPFLEGTNGISIISCITLVSQCFYLINCWIKTHVGVESSCLPISYLLEKIISTIDYSTVFQLLSCYFFFN